MSIGRGKASLSRLAFNIANGQSSGEKKGRRHWGSWGSRPQVLQSAGSGPEKASSLQHLPILSRRLMKVGPSTSKAWPLNIRFPTIFGSVKTLPFHCQNHADVQKMKCKILLPLSGEHDLIAGISFLTTSITAQAAAVDKQSAIFIDICHCGMMQQSRNRQNNNKALSQLQNGNRILCQIVKSSRSLSVALTEYQPDVRVT